MNLDAVKFTLFGGKLTQEQVNGINTLIAEAGKIGITDKRHIAYILATCAHETGKQFRPIKERLLHYNQLLTDIQHNHDQF